ncbi:hypothetical protein ACD591_01335 [Rufibacter glacialis]|uniref:Tetratricopeptide repeat protein n=1 Tax=Rufibacter glacialis TaxID=1259555 RepID=A0A5M8QKM5_9BACT|nr:hypothetical protein [Rufibacter glacialis]KAA6435540.1 hypothetical protein FOE74_06235 [Rufibacter glacialis]GGK64429.1 hypothetical protein GCM10011405_10460 [Rufibacter glacialis]
MDFAKFQESLTQAAPPAQASVYLQAMWLEAQGKWEEAHALIQDLPDQKAAWVHAYLHRKEGDLWNADYWYRRANQKRPSVSWQEEWQQLVLAFL